MAAEDIKRIKTADLRPGMYVDKVDSSWITSPMVMSNFKINDIEDIQKIRKFDISHVLIDTSKGLDLADGLLPEPPGETASIDNTFEVSIDEFLVNRQIPVDIFRFDGVEPELLLKKGLTFGEEAESIFRNKGVDYVRIPISQKQGFVEYKNALLAVSEERRKEGYDKEFLNPGNVEQYLLATRHYYNVNPILLDPEDAFDFDLFLNENYLLNRVSGKGARLDVDELAGWIEEKKSIMIRREDIDVYKAYLQARSQRFRNSDDENIKVVYIQENSRILVENLMENPRSDKLMSETKFAVEDILNVILENPTTFYGLVKIDYYDYNTFVHSVNVATMSLALAVGYGVSDKTDLLELGLGAILHDIGKSRVAHKVINKPGRLTPDEYKQAQAHVMLGYEMLKENKSLPEQSMTPLLQHHEKMTGNGYPNGLDGDNIHLFGRISALIDIYDALTMDRVYKKAIGPYDAMTIISMAMEDYDKALFTQLVHLMQKQDV